MARKTKATKKAKTFKYRKPSASGIKQRAEQRGRGNFDRYIKGDYETYKVKDGANRLRILPATHTLPDGSEPDYFGFPIEVYYSLGPDKGTYIAPSMFGEPDPVDRERRKASRKGDQKYADSLRKKTRVLMWVIDRSDEQAGPKIFSCPPTLDSSIADLQLEESEEGDDVNVDDPYKGYDISFKKSGQGVQTQYDNLRIARSPSPLSDDDDQMEEWLGYITDHPLQDVVNVYSEEHLLKVLTGTATPDGEDDDDEDEDEEERPRRSARENLKRLKSKSRRDDDDEDEDEDDDPDDPPPDDDLDDDGDDDPDDDEGDDDPDDDDEDEEEEEKPKRGRSASRRGRGGSKSSRRSGTRGSARRKSKKDDGDEFDDDVPF